MTIGFFNLLTIVFIILKLAGFIAWSWWLVLMPTIVSVGVVLVCVLITLFIALIIAAKK